MARRERVKRQTVEVAQGVSPCKSTESRQDQLVATPCETGHTNGVPALATQTDGRMHVPGQCGSAEHIVRFVKSVQTVECSRCINTRNIQMRCGVATAGIVVAPNQRDAQCCVRASPLGKFGE